jgi:hypothetical protein
LIDGLLDNFVVFSATIYLPVLMALNNETPIESARKAEADAPLERDFTPVDGTGISSIPPICLVSPI